MSQSIWSTINPYQTTGIMLAALLTDFKDALMSGLSGLSRPSQLQAGGMWIDTTNQTAPNYYWAFKMWTGTVDVEVFRLSVLSGFGGTLVADGTFETQVIADDTAGPIIQLIKQRLIDNGQVLSGDTIGSIIFTGRSATSGDPNVAYLEFTASEDQTITESGGTFSIRSTPDAASAALEHLRMLAGIVETVAPHKLNAERPVGQNVATTSSIVQLSASKLLVEMTGSTATDIKGLNSADGSKEVTIHNRSTAVVTLKHEHIGAIAADRITLARGTDILLVSGESATLYYCTTDTRWKLLSIASGLRPTRETIELSGVLNTFAVPAGIARVNVTTHMPRNRAISANHVWDCFFTGWGWGYNIKGELGNGSAATTVNTPTKVTGSLQVQKNGSKNFAMLFTLTWLGIDDDRYSIVLNNDGAAYAWGFNGSGQLGDGSVTPRSAPVAVLGGKKFASLYQNEYHTLALDLNGNAYGWGDNQNWNLGTGDATPRSSPVAVLGGLKFARLATGNGFNFGITPAGVAYAWGLNNFGALGVGNTTHRSSPVAVLGGLTFKSIVIGGTGGTGASGSAYGLTTAGALYAWGFNNRGKLGVGDSTNRSSPVAVLGGLTFKEVFTDPQWTSVYAITADGTPYAWGENNRGQLGLGDVVARSSPVAVLGGLKFTHIFPGMESCFGITADGTGYAWGYNDKGQLGLGDVVPRSSPVAVAGGLKWHMFRTTKSFGNTTWAATNDGSIYSMGIGDASMTGDGVGASRSSPVAVLGGVAADTRTFIQRTTIEVTPGSTYEVKMPDGIATFGTTPIGFGATHCTIEYDT